MGDRSAQLVWVNANAMCFHRLAARRSILLLAASASGNVFNLISCYPVTEIALRAKHSDDLLVCNSDVARNEVMANLPM